MDATVGVGVREGAGRDAGLIPEALVGRDWSFAQWMSYFEFMHDLSTGQAPLTVRERITVSSRLLAPWHVGTSLSIRLYAAALWAWVWFWFMLAVVWVWASWGVCFLVRPFWTWRELRAVRARLAAKRQAWLVQRKGEKFDDIIGELGIGEVGGGRKEPSLIRFGRLLFIVVWFPINMVLWFIDFFVLAILQFLANVACFLLGQPVLVQERMVVHMKARMQKRLNLMTVFLILIVFPILAIMMPINFVLSGIYVTLRILQAIVGYCRLLLREIPKNLKIINEKGVVAYLKYLRWFYVNMARAFVPMVKDAWQQSFGKGISRT